MELRRGGAIQRRGYVSDSELQRLYQKAFAFVFLSHYEGFGLPVLESMSQARPVISARNSSLPEVGAEAVCYWDGESASTLAEAMLRLEEMRKCIYDFREKVSSAPGGFREFYNKVVSQG